MARSAPPRTAGTTGLSFYIAQGLDGAIQAIHFRLGTRTLHPELAKNLSQLSHVSSKSLIVTRIPVLSANYIGTSTTISAILRLFDTP
jgi:hypothetical protein